MPTALVKFLPPFNILLAPFILLAPVHSILLVLCLHPVHVHVRQDRRLAGPAVCLSVRASSLPAAKLSRWQLQHGPAVAARAPGPFLTYLTYLLFPAESMILGHGLV